MRLKDIHLEFAHETASVHLREVFEASFESTKCSACAGDKWSNSFFCRKCCIKLMRVHLHTHAMKVCVKKAAREFSPMLVMKLATQWDRARDYLITFPRLKSLHNCIADESA